MGGRAGVIRRRFGARRWLLWTVGAAASLIVITLGAIFYTPAPAGAPDVSSLLAGNARPERASAKPYLGITYQELNTHVMDRSDVPSLAGAMVVSVVPGSPGAMGGLRMGDVILAVNGEALGRENAFLKILLKHQPGDRVKLMVQRGQEHLSLEVLLGKQ